MSHFDPKQPLFYKEMRQMRHCKGMFPVSHFIGISALIKMLPISEYRRMLERITQTSPYSFHKFLSISSTVSSGVLWVLSIVIPNDGLWIPVL